MDTYSLLKSLIDIPCPSGYENGLQKTIIDIVSPLVDKIELDVQGNLVAYKKAKSVNSKTLMFIAHADEVGLLVQYIEDDGYIRFSKIGGVDIQILKGRNVVILHEKKEISGVIGVRPIHMENEDSKHKVDISELWIDIGTCSKAETESLVSIGDPIIMDSKLSRLTNNKVSGKACDDKAGIVTLIKALEVLKQNQIESQYNIVLVISVQEEVGARGATTASFNINPDIGIAIDVAHATDYPTINKAKHGDIRLGGGVIIPTSADTSRSIQAKFKDIAMSQNIPFQSLAISGQSGTDAQAIQISRGGCLVGLLSIPCRYMHSPAEVISFTDIEYAAKLIVEFCRVV